MKTILEWLAPPNGHWFNGYVCGLIWVWAMHKFGLLYVSKKRKKCIDCGISLNLDEEQKDGRCCQCQAIKDEANPDVAII